MSADLREARPGTYSALWFRTFLDSIDAAQTAAEVAFLQRQLPLPHYRRVLDLCCGSGRHAIPLAARGYDVIGVDQDARVIEQARGAGQLRARFSVDDVRTTRALTQTRDAVIIMWASFGYFAPAENLALLTKIHTALRPRGRLILDVYNRDFFAQHEGERHITRAGVDVIERKYLSGDRLTVELTYAGHDVVDRFSWQVFRPEELVRQVRALHYEPVRLCAGFADSCAVSPEQPRMQLVVEVTQLRISEP